jgi:hypothetical protein
MSLLAGQTALRFLMGQGLSNANPEAAQQGCEHLQRNRKYQFRRDTPAPLCVACAIRYRPVFRRAITMALIVGTILTLINQGDILFRGAVTALVILKIGLTCTVPYTVSTVSALAANRL